MITVVTSAVGNKFGLLEQAADPTAEFVAYTDKQTLTKPWEIRPAYNRFLSGRRNSRIHKLLIHQYVDTEYSIWMDCNIYKNVLATKVIEDWLDGYDIAMYKHPYRDCIHEENKVCVLINKENEVDVLHEQERRYINHPAHYGLCEAGVIARRHNVQTEIFNNFWWSEYCLHSSRDQISLMYIVNKYNIKINVICPLEIGLGRWQHPYFSYH